jgi:hypothetical protein
MYQRTAGDALCCEPSTSANQQLNHALRTVQDII